MGKPACGLYGLNTIFSWAKSTVDGKISFGGVSEDNVRHAVLLENTYDPRHYICMDASGARMSRTTMESPKGFHIKAGQDCDDIDGTFNINVENGNLNIDIENGDLNVRARNINFKTTGDTNDTGNFTVVSNNQINMKAVHITLLGVDKTVIQANNMLRLLGDVETDFITGICNMTSYSTRRGKKGETQEDVQGEVA